MRRDGQRVMLIRHPETESNAEGRLIGRTDSPLTDTGRKQLEGLSARVAGFRPEVVLSSPIGRALDTARTVAGRGVPVVVLEDLAEVDFGEAEGHTWDELAERGIRLSYSGDGPIAPGGELASGFAGRIVRAAADIEGRKVSVAAITHGGVLRHLLAHWLRLPADGAWRFMVPNATVVVLRLTAEGGVLESFGPV